MMLVGVMGHTDLVLSLNHGGVRVKVVLRIALLAAVVERLDSSNAEPIPQRH